MFRPFAIALVLFISVFLLALWARDTADSKAPPTGDVRTHGAKGDAVTDDTAAIQKAIASSAGAVRFGKGTYRITRTITIDLDKVGFVSLLGDVFARVVMAGAGPAFRFVGTHEGTAAPSAVKDNVWRNQRTPSIDGIEIVGAHEQACGVEATGTMQLTISRLTVRKALHAIHLTRRNRNVLIENCHLYDNRGVGIYYDDVNLHQSNITGCHVSYNAGGGIVSRKGDVRNIHITGCDIEGNMSAAGEATTANVLLDSSGSVNGAGEVAITGCTIQHDKQGKDGANIRIIGRTKPTRELPVIRQGHVTITGNVLSDVQVNIHLKDCRGVTIQGNTLWEGYSHNLLVEDCTSVVVGPNNLDRNPHYDRYGKAREARNRVVFHGCDDCTLTGMHLTAVRSEVALLVKKCRRMNLTGCSILDSEGVALRLEDTTASRVSDCLIRADAVKKPGLSLVVEGGKQNVIVNNVLRDGHKVSKGAAHLAGNHAGE
jgi:hypothetical protein